MATDPPRRAPLRRAGISAPTLDVVAGLAKVSPATVSRFLNNPGVVAEKSARRIREAIAETGYVPNLLAGGLASNRSRLVALIVPSVSQSIFNDTIDAIVDALSRAGYTAMLGLSGEDDTRLSSVVDAAIARRPDGIIITSAGTAMMRERLMQSGITIIETWDLPDSPLDIAVGFSHRALGHAIGEFLMAHGYRRPLVISASGARARARYQGIVEALETRGRPAPRVDYLGGTTRFGEGRRRLASALDSGDPPDLVICSSDWLAQGVIVEALSRGISVPGELAVIGFGNLGFAADMEPPITSVHVHGEQIGSEAVAALLRRAAGEDVQPIVDVGFSIVERGSTR